MTVAPPPQLLQPAGAADSQPQVDTGALQVLQLLALAPQHLPLRFARRSLRLLRQLQLVVSQPQVEATSQPQGAGAAAAQPQGAAAGAAQPQLGAGAQQVCLQHFLARRLRHRFGLLHFWVLQHLLRLNKPALASCVTVIPATVTNAATAKIIIRFILESPL